MAGFGQHVVPERSPVEETTVLKDLHLLGIVCLGLDFCRRKDGQPEEVGDCLPRGKTQTIPTQQVAYCESGCIIGTFPSPLEIVQVEECGGFGRIVQGSFTCQFRIEPACDVEISTCAGVDEVFPLDDPVLG